MSLRAANWDVEQLPSQHVTCTIEPYNTSITRCQVYDMMRYGKEFLTWTQKPTVVSLI